MRLHFLFWPHIPLFSCHASLIDVFPAFLPEKVKLTFHITCREFTYFHILKIRAGCLMLNIYQRLPNFISNMKSQFRKNISYIYCHLSRNKTKPTKWPVCPAKTQIRLGIRTVWSEPSLSAGRTLVFLAIHWMHSERRLIRLGGYPGWSKSSLGAQVSLLVLSCCSSQARMRCGLNV